MYRVKMIVRCRVGTVNAVSESFDLWSEALDWLYGYVNCCDDPENIESVTMESILE